MPYLHDMHIRRQTAKLIVFLCLLLLQVQVLASVSLPCLHASSSPNVDLSGCPMHGFGDAGSRDDLDSSLYDCHRCVVGSCLGAVHGWQASPAPLRVLKRVAVVPVPPKHFYRFAPEASFRPPILHAC